MMRALQNMRKLRAMFLFIFFGIAHTSISLPYQFHYDDYHVEHIFESSDNQIGSGSFYDASKIKKSPKQWTFIIYMAADNDLRGFAARNIKQMAAIGSTEHINIVIQLDIRISGNRKITRRYYIEKGRIVHINANDPDSQQMDSGAPETLISCCKWAIESYPAQHFGLVFWNHGTGILDPERGRIINATELFTFNPLSNKFELDRSIGFFDFINAVNAEQQEERGICWDDSTGNYLTNQSLDYALQVVQRDVLHGQKFSIIGFDACLMSMLEVANIIKKYAHVMVSSQEVELGTGWNYTLVLSPFQQQALDTRAFAEHIVLSYHRTYHQITNDFTLSALDLDNIAALEDNLSAIATLLIDCLKIQRNGSVKRTIKASRDKFSCTHFDEPGYVDQHHFYHNLLANLRYFDFNSTSEGSIKTQELAARLQEGCALISQLAFANSVGSNLGLAKGVSIYFPERKIHPSYRRTIFAQSNNWLNFLTHYLAA